MTPSAPVTHPTPLLFLCLFLSVPCCSRLQYQDATAEDEEFEDEEEDADAEAEDA